MKTIVGYADRWSATHGDTVEFKVSTYGAEHYRADLVRIICGDDDPHRGLYCEEEIEAPFNGTHEGRTQEMAVGSCVIVPQPAAAERLASFTVQAWIYPTLPGGREQGIITHWDGAASCGFALVITAAGMLALRTGDGAIHELSLETRLESRRWHLVAGTFDATTGTLGLLLHRLSSEVEAGENARASGEGGFRPASEALVIAAGEAGRSDHFNGKIDRPIVTGRALDAREVEALAWSGSPHEREPAVVGAWDFSQDIGRVQVTDAGYHRLHGRTVNLPSRGVKGFNWSGREQNWRHSPSEYGAIHFHEDDHYDAGWETDFAFTVPATLASGVYAARLRAGDDEWHVTFFVRPPPGTATAELAFLASTATYMAYSNYRWHMSEPFAEVAETFWTTLTPNDVFLQEHEEFGLSTYDTHADGSGVRYASRLRPVLNMAPRTPLWSFNPDTHILAWLEHCGFAFDVITDEDLHREGAGLLQPYRAVVTGTHPEYYTTPMWDGMRGYLSQGGRLAYLGGNGFIWRCAFSDEWPGALELRRAEDGIRYRDEEPGEYYLEFTGEYGGLWRRLGMAPQALVGVGTVAVGFDRSGFYRRTPESLDPRVSFIFEGIGRDELIGTFGIQGGGASGSEIDATDARLGTPRHALVVARSEGHSADTWIVPDETGFHHSAMDGVQNPDIRADMTFFETPSGGAVFSTGSIAWGASLPHAGWQNNVATVTGNVLNRFLDPEPFAMPAGTPDS